MSFLSLSKIKRSLLICFILLSGCASRGNLSEKYQIKTKSKIASVPFIHQEEYQCGPASLAMMLRHAGKEVTPQALSEQAFTPGKKGSLQSDMLTAVRRQGMLAIPVTTFKKLLLELNNGYPVLVLQNLGLSWYPHWHYAVVVGYDLPSSKMILHSGNKAYLRINQFPFKKTWKRSNNWAYLIVKPGVIPETASESDIVSATAHLEALFFLKEAKLSYQNILQKWPTNLGGLIGLGNIYYQTKDFKQSSLILKQATISHPQSAEAWHNLAVALQANQQMALARKAAERAVALAEEKLIPLYQKNLSQILSL